MRWTEDQLTDYLNRARLERRCNPAPLSGTHDAGPPASTDERESVLQGKIVRWAKEHGYPCQSNRQTKHAQGLLTPGWPDICLILPKRVVFIELKSTAGRTRKEQARLRIHFLSLGHEIFEIRTWKRFMEVINA